MEPTSTPRSRAVRPAGPDGHRCFPSVAGRSLRAALALAALSACVDLAGPGSTTPEAVAGIYSVCSLVFTPEGGLSPVDVRAAAFDPQRRPRLALDVAPQTLELEYTPPRASVARVMRGEYRLSAGQVALRFGDAEPRPSALLLPERLALDFTPFPQSLRTGASERYAVPRSEYLRLGGSEAAGAATVAGRLSAHFAVGGCG